MRFLARDSIFYGGAAVLNKLFMLVTLPLLARHFSVVDYGRIDLLTVATLFLATLAVFGQDSAVARFLHEPTDPRDRRQMVGQSLMVQIACGLAVSAALAFLVLQDSAGPADTLLLLLVLAQVPFLVLGNFSQNLLKWSFSRGPFAAVALGSVAANALALLVGVFAFGIGVHGVFAIALGVRAAAAALGLWLVRGWLAWPTSLSSMRMLLPFAIPFGILGAVGTFVPALERVAVESQSGEVALGLYAVGATVGLAMALPVQAFQMAWGPFAVSIHRERDAVRTYGHVLKAFTILICLAALALAALAPLLIRLVASDRYAEAGAVVFPISLGVAVQGIGWVTEVGITLSKRSHLQLPGYAVFLAMAVAGAFTFPALVGFQGVAWAVFLGLVGKAALNAWLAQRAYPITWPLGALVAVLVATLAGGLLVAQAQAFGWPVVLVVALCTGILVAVVSWRALLDGAERAAARAALARLAVRLRAGRGVLGEDRL